MNDLCKKTTRELKILEEEFRAELFALKFQSSMGNLDCPHRIKFLRKQIARVLTIISSRRIAGEDVRFNINLNDTYAKVDKKLDFSVSSRVVNNPKIKGKLAKRKY